MFTKELTEVKPQPAQFQLLFEVDGKELLRYNVRLEHFNFQFLKSSDLMYVMRDCVRDIKNDLVSKSRIYSQHLINKPVKLTGFNGGEATYLADDSFSEHTVHGINKKEEEKTEKTFKVSFLCNGRASFEEIFDATHIPQFVLDKFSPFNNLSEVSMEELVKLDFTMSLIHKMQLGKQNLIQKFVEQINEASKNFVSE